MKIVSLEDPIISFHNHPKALMEFAEENGCDPAQLLRAAGITEYAAGQYQQQISYLEYKQLINACKTALGDSALGLHFGEKLGFHGHGLIGFAVMACQNVGEAIDTAILFKKAISPITNMELRRLPEHAHLVCMPAFEGGEEQRFFVEVLFAALMFSFHYNLQEANLNFRFEFNYEEPDCVDEYKRLFGDNIAFNSPQNRMSCSSDVLDLPLRYSNPAIINDAKLNADATLVQLNQQAGFLEAIRLYIKSTLPEYPSIDAVAEHFNVSRSTLKRRLQAHNTSYKTLIDEVKMNKACELLESSRLSVDEISSHLYFSEGAAFRRAFKRCCGMSPSAYRKQSSLRLVS